MKTNSKKVIKLLFTLAGSMSFIHCGGESAVPQYLPSTSSITSNSSSNSTTTTTVSSATSSVASQLNSLGLYNSTTANDLSVIQNYSSQTTTQIQAALQDIYNVAPSVDLSGVVSALSAVNVYVTNPTASSSNNNLYAPLSYNFTVIGSSPNFTINTQNYTANNDGRFPKWIVSPGNTLQVGLKMTSPGVGSTVPGTSYKFPFRCLLYSVTVYRAATVGAPLLSTGTAGATYQVLVSNTGSTITNTSDPCYVQNNGPVYTHPVLNLSKELIAGTYPTVSVKVMASDNCQAYSTPYNPNGNQYAGCPVNNVYSAYQFASTIDIAYSGTRALTQQ